MSDPLLCVSDLVVDFKTRAGNARVLDHISLSVNKGEILGIVGESGCGKSMTALSIMGLIPDPPGKITSGSIKLGDQELVGMGVDDLCRIRGKEIGMIFQEPMTSLNPVFTVGEQIAESVRLHEGATAKAAHARAVEMLEAVEIPEAAARAHAYPHQLSGGMRQRVMIAMALACRPRVLIADEPTTALDTTVQAQIFDLLQNLQDEMGTAIIMITHDMGAIAELADTVAVMYAGRIVKKGKVDTVLSHPDHPYTRGLIACVPHLSATPGPVRERLMEIEGVVPALTDLGKGCAFAPRCPLVMDKCRSQKPHLLATQEDHLAACWAVEPEVAQ
ncbi:ABC transporter ATP-binding protein [Sulfitobacter sp. S190]|uniref:ABC transporter ATP-binding protein n=1 Tax=Sulfitobacter sp. S190 TaxID=2867022 RepID=UPI0021A56613|nr:ABC transporter ATP-binding protein [Sulfitobacter sp. S190]UWR22029.1 ABC transporter ATP-binding protein [Sulfitobacter sp. S190]